MDKNSKHYIVYNKISQIYPLMEEKYPWATPYLLFNFNRIPSRLFQRNLYSNRIWKAGLLFLCNVDKFTLEKPKLFKPTKVTKDVKFNFIIPNLKKLTKEDVNNFNPIQIVTWKGKVVRILDGMHRAYIANKLKEPIMCVEVKSHSYNNHPNNKKIIKLAKELKDITLEW